MTQSLTSILITSKITKTCNPLNAYPVHIYPPEFDFWLDYAQLTWVECAWRLPAANHQQSAAAPGCIVYMHNMRYIYIYYIWYYICMYVCRGAVSWPEIESEPRTTAMAAHCLGVTHWFRAIPVARGKSPKAGPLLCETNVSSSRLLLTHTRNATKHVRHSGAIHLLLILLLRLLLHWILDNCRCTFRPICIYKHLLSDGHGYGCAG